MHKCKNCKSDFPWITLYNSFLFNYKPITCLYCNTTHKVRFISRLIAVSISIVPFILIYLLLLEVLRFNFGASLLLALISSLFISFLYPILAKYTPS